ncbi:MAG: hypothetical protein ABI167_08465 [Nitrosospira sp.]
MAFTDTIPTFLFRFMKTDSTSLSFMPCIESVPAQGVAFRIDTESRIAAKKTGKAPDEAGRVLHHLFRADAPAQSKI